MIDALIHAYQTLITAAGREVRYIRGETELTFVSVPGESSFDLTEASGLITNLRLRDELVAAEDLAELGAGEDAEPQSGDRVEIDHDGGHQDGGFTNVYEVMAPGASSPKPWRWHVDGRVYRIHTAYIQTLMAEQS